MLTFEKTSELQYNFRYTESKTHDIEAHLEASSFLLEASAATCKQNICVAKTKMQCSPLWKIVPNEVLGTSFEVSILMTGPLLHSMTRICYCYIAFKNGIQQTWKFWNWFTWSHILKGRYTVRWSTLSAFSMEKP